MKIKVKLMKRTSIGVLTCALVGASLGATAASATLIVNGDFEAGATGFATDYTPDPVLALAATYTVASTVPNGWAPGFGDHTSGTGLMGIFNASESSTDRFWSQSIVLSAGTTYVFDGWVAALTESTRPGTAPILELRVDGVAQGSFDAAGLDDVWQSFSLSWTAPVSGAAEVALHDLRAAGSGDDFALDDLVLVPEPSTALLMGLGLAALIGRRRDGGGSRRRRWGANERLYS